MVRTIYMEPRTQSNFKLYGIIFLVLVLGISAWFFFTRDTPPEENIEETPNQSQSTTVLPYGLITLRIGETASVRGISITPTKVTEDSRCPTDVTCVWSGTVKVTIKSTASGKTQNDTLTLGSPSTIDVFTVKLVSVHPQKTQKEIAEKDYELTFDVHQAIPRDTESNGK